MSKARPNKLDQFAEQLDAWERDGKTLTQMVEMLKGLKCSTSISSLSPFLERRRTARDTRDTLQLIAAGSQQVSEVRAQFDKTPPPALAEILTLHRTLIWLLSARAKTDPKLLGQVTAMMKPVMEFARLQAQELERQLDERRVKVLESKAQQADAAKGLLEDPALSQAQREGRMRELFGMPQKVETESGPN